MQSPQGRNVPGESEKEQISVIDGEWEELTIEADSTRSGGAAQPWQDLLLQIKMAQPWHCRDLGLNISLVWRTAQCILGCYAASLASPTRCRSILPVRQVKMSQPMSNVPWKQVLFPSDPGQKFYFQHLPHFYLQTFCLLYFYMIKMGNIYISLLCCALSIG